MSLDVHASMAKIISANIYIVRIDGRHPIVVELQTDAAISGVGEAAVAYGVGETAAAGMIKDLMDRIVLGCDPFRIEALWSEMYDHTFWAKGGGPHRVRRHCGDRAGLVGHQGQDARVAGL